MELRTLFSVIHYSKILICLQTCISQPDVQYPKLLPSTHSKICSEYFLNVYHTLIPSVSFFRQEISFLQMASALTYKIPSSIYSDSVQVCGDPVSGSNGDRITCHVCCRQTPHPQMPLWCACGHEICGLCSIIATKW
jgi:hypothetical protein